MSSNTSSFSYICLLTTLFTLFHSSFSNKNSMQSCIGYEKTALLEFKNDLIDAANRLVSWNRSSQDCCKWYGITCSNLTGHVIELRLCGPDPVADFDTQQQASVQRFGGKLNPSLQNLTSLEYLDLSYNDFGGKLIQLTAGFMNMISLTTLDLSNNQFTGVLPAGLMSMISLTALDLSNNELTGIQAMSNLSTENMCSLREINLSWNKFDGKSLLDVLTSLFECESSKLESLEFASSGLSGNIPLQLGNLKNMVYIDLYGNSISGLIPDSLGNLSSLQILDLGSNYISGPIPSSLGSLSSLLSMSLSSNSISGPLPESLGMLSALELLDLSYNEIDGTLPQSIGQLTKLTRLSIKHNHLTGVVTEDHFANLTSLVSLQGDANMLRLELPLENWQPPFQLEILTLTSWSLGPKFPSWIQNQTNLSILYLGSTGISDNIPSWFWSSFSGLQYLNISDNDLSLVSLNDFLCSKTEVEQKQVIYMNLGNTNLSDVLPGCWTNWGFLNILNFQNNNLTGEIPRSLANSSSLESLDMQKNKLSGELPISLLNSNTLKIIDLSENKLTGGIPIPVAGEATVLKLLSLRSNKLSGKIPDEICRLDSIQILDLSENNLSGRIPNCFGNYSVMSGKVDPNQDIDLAGEEFRGSAWLVMSGRVNGYASILGLVTFLDLSGNDLYGVIPSEITQLVELRFLNFSGNRLTGRIPEKIGDMKLLQLFDLSRNRLDGMIPLSMSKLSFLNSLNLSYNNLTGRIPLGTQLQSFHESSFVGNQLCGAPVSSRCERQGGTRVRDDGEGDGSNGPDWGLITSIVLRFVVGFWVVVAPLVGSKLWRTKYYQFLYGIWFKFRGS